MPTWTENSVKFSQTPLRVRKEHQSKATYYRVEGGIGELHGLTIRDADLNIGCGAQSETGLFDHGDRSIGCGDMTVTPHDIQCRLGGKPGSGCDIQHSLSNANLGGAQQEWDKMAGDPSHRVVVPPGSGGIIGYFRHDFLQFGSPHGLFKTAC